MPSNSTHYHVRISRVLPGTRGSGSMQIPIEVLPPYGTYYKQETAESIRQLKISQGKHHTEVGIRECSGGADCPLATRRTE